MKNSILNYVLIKKFIIPLLLVLVVIVCYLAFRPTLQVYQRYSVGCSTDQLNTSLSVSPSYTANRIKHMDTIYSRFVVDTLSWKNSLWNVASGLSQKYHCNITAYPVMLLSEFNEHKLYKQQLAYTGAYNDLLMVMQDLERTSRLGRVTSVRLSRKPREQATTLNIEFTGVSKH